MASDGDNPVCLSVLCAAVAENRSFRVSFYSFLFFLMFFSGECNDGKVISHIRTESEKVFSKSCLFVLGF